METLRNGDIKRKREETCKKITIKVNFTNGDWLITDFRGNMIDAVSYYRGDREFAYWDALKDGESKRRVLYIERLA